MTPEIQTRCGAWRGRLGIHGGPGSAKIIFAKIFNLQEQTRAGFQYLYIRLFYSMSFYNILKYTALSLSGIGILDYALSKAEIDGSFENH